MPLNLTYDELLHASNREREKWRGWLLLHPAAVELSVQPGGRLPTVGKLIDHIFLVERQHLQRLTGEHVSQSTGLTGNNAPPLFDYGASVRRELAQFVALLEEDESDAPRKLLFHLLLHETRCWAQVAFAVQLAGLEPPPDEEL
jgi:uncharacterized damage-inducible protein DinB